MIAMFYVNVPFCREAISLYALLFCQHEQSEKFTLTQLHSFLISIVSTKSGSTGRLSSIFNMAYGLQGFAEHNQKKAKHLQPGDEELIFAVREPFASRKTKTGIQAGVIRHQNKLIVESYMPANGVIFSDGVENDFLKFNSGSIATIGIAKEKARLVEN